MDKVSSIPYYLNYSFFGDVGGYRAMMAVDRDGSCSENEKPAKEGERDKERGKERERERET